MPVHVVTSRHTEEAALRRGAPSLPPRGGGALRGVLSGYSEAVAPSFLLSQQRGCPCQGAWRTPVPSGERTGTFLLLRATRGRELLS